MREYKLNKLINIARENLGNSDLAIYHLMDDVLDGTIPTCRARRIYPTLRTALIIDMRRYASLMAAASGEPQEHFFDGVKLARHESFFMA